MPKFPFTIFASVWKNVIVAAHVNSQIVRLPKSFITNFAREFFKFLVTL